MSAMPVEWHEECLQNMTHHAKQLHTEYESIRDRLQMLESDICLLRRQIARAKRLGKTKFDAERFRDTD